MFSEVKTCQNCNTDFIIEPEDFLFYEKIKVPPPTFCPRCSHQRRFAWRNTHALFHRPDAVTGKDLISIYHPDVTITAIDQKYWWSDSWDPMDYEREYNFDIDFFTQWRALRDVVPFQALSNSKAINSEYCNVAEESYDSYLCSASWKIERCLYSDSILQTKDCVDVYVVKKSEFCYEDIYCQESYKLFYSEHANNCTDSYFLYDCKSCVNCFMCSGLRNKSYCFKNVQYSREDYLAKVSEYNLGSYNTTQKLLNEFEKLKLSAIHRYAHITNGYNSTGDNLANVKNVVATFDAGDIEDSKDLFWAEMQVKESRSSGPGIGQAELAYEVFDAGVGASNLRFCSVVYSSRDVDYSFNCYNSHDLFGCIGLRNKSYCILNKQYSKEEYFTLREKIISHMNEMPYIDAKGRVYRYGEFFPIELSPFAYNETLANSFYPLSKEQIRDAGFLYRAPEAKKYMPTIAVFDTPDDIHDAGGTITQEIFPCDTLPGSDRCTLAFKITSTEFDFYKRFSIPLPRRCYQCRHKNRFQKRTPLELWTRTCMNQNSPDYSGGPCENVFETSYSPHRPEIVYCEKCYLREVV